MPPARVERILYEHTIASPGRDDLAAPRNAIGESPRRSRAASSERPLTPRRRRGCWMALSPVGARRGPRRDDLGREFPS